MGNPLARPPGLEAWLRARAGRRAGDPSRAWAWARQALAQVGSPPEEELFRRGYRIRLETLSVPGALVRGRVLIEQRLVLLDPEGLEDLSERLRRRGLSGEARERILAHELFHVLEPECPEDLAELSAHLFAGRLLNLEEFPGALDLEDSRP